MSRWGSMVVGLVAMGCAGGAGSVQAETPVDMPDVEVVADGMSRDFEVFSPSLNISMSSIDSDLINRQSAWNLTEALRYMPGVHTETRGRKLRELVSFRGQLYPYPTYAIDGLWLGKFDEAARWFPAAQLGEIEMVRSSAALRLGFSDLTGVINFRPARFSERTTLLETEVGSYDTFRASVTHGDRLARGDYMIGLNHHQSEGGPSGVNAAENVQSVIGRGSWRATDDLTMETVVFYLRGESEWPVPNDPDPGYDERRAAPEEYDPFEQYLIGLRGIHRQSDASSTEISAVFSERTGEYYSPEALSPLQRRGTDRDYDYNVNATQTLRLSPDNVFRVGLMYNRWKTPLGSHFFWNAPSDVHSFGAFAAQELTFDRLTLDWGARYSHNYNRIRSQRAFTMSGAIRGTDFAEREWGEPLAMGTAGAVYRLTEETGLYTHVAAGRAAPDADRRTLQGQPLADEMRWMGDAGVKWERADIGLVKLGGFVVYREDATTFDQEKRVPPVDGPLIAYYENADITHYGVEFESRTAPLAGIATIYLNATAMESREKRPDEASAGVNEVPEWIVNGGVYADHRAWDVNLFARAVGGYENNRFNSNGTMMSLGGYEDVNLTVGYTFDWGRGTRVYATVRNILDQDYSTVDGWRHYGTEYSAGVQQSF